MSSVNRQKIIDYLEDGGSVYMEGADVAYNHHTAPFFDYFGTGLVSTGANQTIISVDGLDETFIAGLDYFYFGGYDAHYKIDELSAEGGTAILKSEDQKIRAVANYTELYKTICSSTLIGALANGAELNLRGYLMGQYLDFLAFDIIPLFPPTNLAVDALEGLFTWDAPEMRELTGYDIYLDGILQGNTEDLEWQFTDLINGTTYLAGIIAVYEEGFSELVTLEFTYSGTGVGNGVVAVTELTGNYPNPFNPCTNIAFSVSTPGHVKLEVFNIKGVKVKTLINSELSVDKYTIEWNGTDDNSKLVSSGVYFYKMRVGKFVSTKKMILLK